ncbi:MAG: hypothetical protein WCY93_11305 [Anaerolineaceae bacterium]
MDKLREYKASFSNEISEFLWNHVLFEMTRSGVNFDDNLDDMFPHMILVLEAIRSLHLYANDIEHPLQDIAEEMFPGGEPDEESAGEEDSTEEDPES